MQLLEDLASLVLQREANEPVIVSQDMIDKLIELDFHGLNVKGAVVFSLLLEVDFVEQQVHLALHCVQSGHCL